MRMYYYVIGMLISFLLSSFMPSNAQTDKNAAKLLMLKDKVTRAEAKVAAAQRKMAIADSLMTTGESRIEEAEADFDLVELERIDIEKEYRSKSKELTKLAKSDEEGVANKAEADLKALDTWFNSEIKRCDNEVKVLTKKATKAEADIDKGTELEKTAKDALKEAQKVYEEALQNYEAAMAGGAGKD